MAVKIPVNNALVAAASKDIGLPLGELVQVSNPETALPRCKIVYPIECPDPDRGLKSEHAFMFGLTDGSTFNPVPAPFVMTALSGTDAIRQLQLEDGTPFDKNNPAHAKAGGSYTTYYRGVSDKVNNKTKEAYKQTAGKAGWHQGASWLVAIISNKAVTIAEFPMFDLLQKYWHPALRQALWANGLGVKVQVSNHSDNLTTSAQGNKYLNPKKFSQWEVVELTKEQIEAIAAMCAEKKADMAGWFER